MGVALRGKTRWVAVAVVVAVALVVGLRSWLLLGEPPQSVVPKSQSVAPQPVAPSGPDWALTAPLTLMPQPPAPQPRNPRRSLPCHRDRPQRLRPHRSRRRRLRWPMSYHRRRRQSPHHRHQPPRQPIGALPCTATAHTYGSNAASGGTTGIAAR